MLHVREVRRAGRTQDPLLRPAHPYARGACRGAAPSGDQADWITLTARESRGHQARPDTEVLRSGRRAAERGIAARVRPSEAGAATRQASRATLVRSRQFAAFGGIGGGYVTPS